MLELFELSRFFFGKFPDAKLGSEFLQQEYGLLKKLEPSAPNLNFEIAAYEKYLLL